MSFLKKVKELEDDIKFLKIKLKQPKEVNILFCTKKKMLEQYTINELKQFIKENGIEIYLISKMLKEDWINVVWKTIKKIKEKVKEIDYLIY